MTSALLSALKTWTFSSFKEGFLFSKQGSGGDNIAASEALAFTLHLRSWVREHHR